jgi:hypothetical protein
MAKKVYQFYCEICNWKRITDGSDLDDLYEVKKSPVPGGVPELDENKKIVEKKSKKQPKKFRCPQCGRSVGYKEIANPQEKIKRHQEEKKAQKERREWEALEAEAKERYEQSRIEYEEEQDRFDGY